MKLTIGMASYNNFEEVWFTVQALRMYQDLADTEILVVDNYGKDQRLKRFIENWASKQARYELSTDIQGTAPAKNQVFARARGEWVFCIDSHVMLVPGAVARVKAWIAENPACMDLLQGPILWDSLDAGADSFKEGWGSGMWGQWHNLTTDRTVPPYEIPMMGMGLFGCRRDAWLGFNPEFRGFGGEEGYIHEKYRKAGRKTLCLPWLQWLHRFQDPRPIPAFSSNDKLRNYYLGFRELGLDMAPLVQHFGRDAVDGIAKQICRPNPEELFRAASAKPSDINEHLIVLARAGSGKRVVELGVRDGVSTIGWLYGRPAMLVSYDVNPCPREAVLTTAAKEWGITFRIIQGDSREVDIPETDVLFIDTLHTAGQLSMEFARHAGKVSAGGKIILHDTETFGERGEDGGPGLNAAIMSFLAVNPDWREEHRYRNNNGLTILKKSAECGVRSAE